MTFVSVNLHFSAAVCELHHNVCSRDLCAGWLPRSCCRPAEFTRWRSRFLQKKNRSRDDDFLKKTPEKSCSVSSSVLPKRQR